MGEDPSVKRNVSKRMSLVIGARRHLEWGHEKYVMDMIHSHPAQVNCFNVFIVFFSEQNGYLVLSLVFSCLIVPSRLAGFCVVCTYLPLLSFSTVFIII